MKLVYGKPYNAKIGTIQRRLGKLRLAVGSIYRRSHHSPSPPLSVPTSTAWPLRKDDTHKSRRVRPFFFFSLSKPRVACSNGKRRMQKDGRGRGKAVVVVVEREAPLCIWPMFCSLGSWEGAGAPRLRVGVRGWLPLLPPPLFVCHAMP